jgi:hypothetical protein
MITSPTAPGMSKIPLRSPGNIRTQNGIPRVARVSNF